MSISYRFVSVSRTIYNIGVRSLNCHLPFGLNELECCLHIKINLNFALQMKFAVEISFAVVNLSNPIFFLVNIKWLKLIGEVQILLSSQNFKILYGEWRRHKFNSAIFQLHFTLMNAKIFAQKLIIIFLNKVPSKKNLFSSTNFTRSSIKIDFDGV